MTPFPCILVLTESTGTRKQRRTKQRISLMTVPNPRALYHTRILPFRPAHGVRMRSLMRPQSNAASAPGEGCDFDRSLCSSGYKLARKPPQPPHRRGTNGGVPARLSIVTAVALRPMRGSLLLAGVVSCQQYTAVPPAMGL